MFREKCHPTTLNNQRDMSHHNLSVNNLLSSQNKLPLSRQNSISSHRSEGLSRQNSIRTPLPLTPQSSVGSNSLEEYKRNNLLTTNGNGDQDRKEKSSEKENGITNDENEENVEDRDSVRQIYIFLFILEHVYNGDGLFKNMTYLFF